jgi:hypothetical protein
MNGHVSKPLSFEEAMMILKKHLETGRAREPVRPR